MTEDSEPTVMMPVAPLAGPKRIRVLRVIEYMYDDVARYIEDRTRWTDHLNVNRMTMSGAIVSIHMEDGKGDWEQYAGLPDQTW